jgi:hypothetical protein
MHPSRYEQWLSSLLDDAGKLNRDQTCEAAARLLNEAGVDQDTARSFVSHLNDDDKLELVMYCNALPEGDDEQ